MLGAKVVKYKKIVSILLLAFCFALAVVTSLGLISEFAPGNVAAIRTTSGVVKFQLTEKITTEDNTAEKLSKKIKITSTGKTGNFGMIKIASNNVMFDYTIGEQVYYLSAAGKSINTTSEHTFTATASTSYLSNSRALTNFRNSVNSGTTYSGQTVELTNDIGLGGEEWTPIGHKLNRNFQGTFDGNDHTISNFVITKACVIDKTITSGVGFFGFMEKSATIKNLKISNARITISNNADNCTPYGYGILVGHFGNSIVGNYKASETSNLAEVLNINNCEIENSSITIPNGYNAKDRFWSMGVGGLIGSAKLATSITNCSVATDISFSGSFSGKSASSKARNYVGGIMGGQIRNYLESWPSGTVAISNCLFSGSIKNNASVFPWGQVAGILGGADTQSGYNNNYWGTVIIKDCYAYMTFVAGRGLQHHPICCGNYGEWNSGYTNNFYTNATDTYYQHFKPYYRVRMENNYFALKSNNTKAYANSTFRTNAIFNTSTNKNGKFYSYSFDGEHYYESGSSVAKSSTYLYSQPNYGGVTCEVPIQVNPSTFNRIS